MASGPIPRRFAQLIRRQCRDLRYELPSKQLKPGQTADPVFVDDEVASHLAVDVAKRAVGLPEASRRKEVAWVDGDRLLAIGVAGIKVSAGEGSVIVHIPVRCDETGPVLVSAAFAVSDGQRPAGMFAATERVPRGPEIVVDSWGDALVAFAWQLLVGLATDIASAVGDAIGEEHLVPAQITAKRGGLEVFPMGRHRLQAKAPAAVSAKKAGP